VSYRFRRRESVEDGLRRIAREQIVRAVVMARDASADPHHRIHKVRRRFKKLRGLVRLVRPGLGGDGVGYRDENARYRDAARGLAEARDAQTAVEALDSLLERYAEPLDREAFAGVRDEFVRARAEQVAARPRFSHRLEETVERLTEAHDRVGSWRLDDDGFAALRRGLVRSYARGRKALKRARKNPTAERFHEWRKRVQYHGFHGRLLRSIWKRPMKARRKEIDALSDLLGDDHDLSVLADALRDGPASTHVDEVRALLGLAVQRRRELRWRAMALGERVYAEKPGLLARRFGAHWEAWRGGRARDEGARVQELELVGV